MELCSQPHPSISWEVYVMLELMDYVLVQTRVLFAIHKEELTRLKKYNPGKQYIVLISHHANC